MTPAVAPRAADQCEGACPCGPLARPVFLPPKLARPVSFGWSSHFSWGAQQTAGNGGSNREELLKP